MDLFFYLSKLNVRIFSRKEKLVLEAKFLTTVYKELEEIFKSRYKNYLRLIKSSHDKEENMFFTNFLRELIYDIVSTEEYSLNGIATYAHIPEEVLYDIITGINLNPTFDVSRKLFELHAHVRRDFYQEITRKFLLEFSDQGNPINSIVK